MLKPEKMVKIRVIASSERKDAVISALHDAGVMQIEDVSPEISSILNVEKNESYVKEISEYLQKFRGYENFLPPSKVENKVKFSSVDDILAAAKSINLDDDLKMIHNKQEDIGSTLRDIQNRLFALNYIKNIDTDMSIFNGNEYSSYIIPAEKIDTSPFSRSGAKVMTFDGFYIVTVKKTSVEDVAKIAGGMKVQMIHIPEMRGKPADNIKKLDGIKKVLEEKLDGINQSLKKISERYYEKIVQIREALEIEAKKSEVSNRFMGTEYTFTMEGWIPAKDYDSIVRLLENITEKRIIVSKVKTDEIPPTLFNNPKRISLFEFFIKFYSLPQGTEYDPTLIFALVFPIFFGFMVGDWGYGLIILFISLFIIHRIDHPPSKSHIPKVISRFVLMIMSANSLKILAKALIPSSIVAVVAGLLFNEFFGFHLLPFTVFPVYTVLPKLMLIAGYIGLFMVSFGFILGFTLDMSAGDKKGAMDRIGWLLFAIGISVVGLNLIHHDLTLVYPAGLLTYIGIAFIIIGLPLIMIKEKSQGFIEMPSIISHILSYLRLVGILIASVVIAEIIDLVFMKSVVSHSIGLAVLGIIILIFGQLFNIVLAVFEPGIQGARLIYVEFFSKFYKGNGHYFRPLKTNRKYTLDGYEYKTDVKN